MKRLPDPAWWGDDSPWWRLRERLLLLAGDAGSGFTAEAVVNQDRVVTEKDARDYLVGLGRLQGAENRERALVVRVAELTWSCVLEGRDVPATALVALLSSDGRTRW